MELIVKSILVLLQLPTAFPLSIYGSPLNGLEREFYLSNELGHQTPDNVQKYPIPFPKSETSFNSNSSPIRIEPFQIEPFQIENYPIETYPVETTQIESFISKSDLKNSIRFPRLWAIVRLLSGYGKADKNNGIFRLGKVKKYPFLEVGIMPCLKLGLSCSIRYIGVPVISEISRNEIELYTFMKSVIWTSISGN